QLANAEEQLNLLFGLLQYVQLQVVLFDSIDDAAFDEFNDVSGAGTVRALLVLAKPDGVEVELKNNQQDSTVCLVLTAYPTHFYPGNVVAIINDLEQAIRTNKIEHINLLLRQLGKTPFFN